MKKIIALVLCTIVLLCATSFFPNSAEANTSFNPINTDDQISWKVNNYNETNNAFDPADWWRTSDWAFLGEYNLSIGDYIDFTVTNPSLCTGTLEIGNFELSTTRHDIGFNLIIVTGPPGFYTYSFDPAFISHTNWSEQIQLAINASIEQSASITNQTSYKMFLGVNRSIISFNWSKSGAISNSTYDYETGLLLHLYVKSGNWYLEMSIYSITTAGIPGFLGIFVIFTLIGLIILRQLFKKTKMTTKASIRFNTVKT